MNSLTKLALGAVVAGGVAMVVAVPSANAGVSIGIGIGGGPGPNNPGVTTIPIAAALTAAAPMPN